MASAAQIAANQANAQKSTGPKSPPGKAMSCRNSVKHGMSGRGIVLPEAEERAVAERLEDWRDSYAVTHPHEEFALREMVRESVRIERCNADDVSLRGRMVDRAKTCWDDDRRVAAEELGQTIHRRPSLVVKKLQMTPQGCDWLIDRWTALALAVQSGVDWSDEHRALASDLLGVDPGLRDGPLPLDLPKDVPFGFSRARHRLIVIHAEIDRLRARRDGVVARLDAEDRALVSDGVEVEPDRPLGRLRRYAAGCRRRFDAAARVLRGAATLAADVHARPRLAALPPTGAPVASADVTPSKLFATTQAGPKPELPVPVVPVAAGRDPEPPARPMNRQQRRALARRRPELALR
jgi:hypothetical protein